MFGSNGGTHWSLRYAQNLPMRIRQIGSQVHAHFVDSQVTFHLLEVLNVPPEPLARSALEDGLDGNVNLAIRDRVIHGLCLKSLKSRQH